MRGGLRSIASKLWQCFLDSLYPKHCLGCDNEGSYYCNDCQQKPITQWRGGCFGCGEKTENGKLCRNCEIKYAFDAVFIMSDYDDEIIGTLIKNCKYQFVKELTKDLGKLGARFLKTKNIHACLVPVPLSAKRRRWRGFNQVEEIANVIAKETNIEIQHCLERIKNKKAQAKLSEIERLTNMQGCYKVVGEVPETVILFDDVITTGATINECAKVLRLAGAETIFVLALAKG